MSEGRRLGLLPCPGADALGSGVPEARGGGGCRQGRELRAPSPLHLRESDGEGRGGRLRGRCGPWLPARGSASAVGQRLAGVTVHVPGLVCERPAAPGPFPSLRTRLPETLGLPELPRCFSSSGLHVRVPWDPVRKFGGVLTNSTVTDAEAEER